MSAHRNSFAASWDLVEHSIDQLLHLILLYIQLILILLTSALKVTYCSK